MPVGDPDGPAETIDLDETFAELSQTSNEETATELIQELAWVYNQTLPLYSIFVTVRPTWYTTDEWEYPSTDDPDMSIRYPSEWLLRVGKLRATE